MPKIPLRELPAFEALTKHHSQIEGRHLRELFAEDLTRGERFCAEAAGLYLDYSKNRITIETMSLLLELAEQSGLQRHRDAMFAGEKINVSEGRSVLHVALRMPKGTSLVVDGVDVVAEVHRVLDQMAVFANKIRSGEWKGHTGKPIRNIINIGIGGSDLGPLWPMRHCGTTRAVTSRSVSSLTSTRPTSSKPRGTSLLTKPCLSCRPRRSGPSKR